MGLFTKKLTTFSRELFSQKNRILDVWQGATKWVEFLHNPTQPGVASHTKTSHLFCSAKQMTEFYMKCNNKSQKILR